MTEIQRHFCAFSLELMPLLLDKINKKVCFYPPPPLPQVAGVAASKNHTVEMVGKALLYLLFAVSTLTKAAAVILFVTPGLGLFSVLRHWRLGSLPAAADVTYDVVSGPDGTPVVRDGHGALELL